MQNHLPKFQKTGARDPASCPTACHRAMGGVARQLETMWQDICKRGCWAGWLDKFPTEQAWSINFGLLSFRLSCVDWKVDWIDTLRWSKWPWLSHSAFRWKCWNWTQWGCVYRAVSHGSAGGWPPDNQRQDALDTTKEERREKRRRVLLLLLLLLLSLLLLLLQLQSRTHW